MPEYERVEQLPEYSQALVDHQIALRDAGENENEQLRAKLKWSEKTKELELHRLEANRSEQAMNNARTKIKEEYPDVPEHIYIGATDPESMQRVAKDFNDAVQSRIQSQQPQEPSGASGQPPTGVGADNRPVADWRSRELELSQKIREGRATPFEVEERDNIFINMRTRPSQERAKSEALRNG